MKNIPLTNGGFVMVDDSDYDWLSQWKWHAQNYKHTSYACRATKKDGKLRRVWMHREILALTDRKEQGDHIDRNGLNNQRSNLRKCTHAQNQANRKPQRGKRYLGISFYKARNKWRATIKSNGKRYELGDFAIEADAAKAYNDAATKLHGEFANLNLIKD